jgi:fumarate reductase subunit C
MFGEHIQAEWCVVVRFLFLKFRVRIVDRRKIFVTKFHGGFLQFHKADVCILIKVKAVFFQLFHSSYYFHWILNFILNFFFTNKGSDTVRTINIRADDIKRTFQNNSP